MPTLAFTQHLRNVLDPAPQHVQGATVRDALDDCFVRHPLARNYVLDEQGRLRKHVAIFLNSERGDPATILDKPVTAACDIFVMQALSGG